MFQNFLKRLFDKSLPCRKIGHGQQKVMINTNFDGPESPMMHTKCLLNRSVGYVEEEFQVYLPGMDMAAILVK